VVSESVVVVCGKLVERGEEWSGGAALGGRGGDVGFPRWLPLIIMESAFPCGCCKAGRGPTAAARRAVSGGFERGEAGCERQSNTVYGASLKRNLD
jgi:hypothetical protein